MLYCTVLYYTILYYNTIITLSHYTLYSCYFHCYLTLYTISCTLLLGIIHYTLYSFMVHYIHCLHYIQYFYTVCFYMIFYTLTLYMHLNSLSAACQHIRHLCLTGKSFSTPSPGCFSRCDGWACVWWSSVTYWHAVMLLHMGSVHTRLR